MGFSVISGEQSGEALRLHLRPQVQEQRPPVAAPETGVRQGAWVRLYLLSLQGQTEVQLKNPHGHQAWEVYGLNEVSDEWDL